MSAAAAEVTKAQQLLEVQRRLKVQRRRLDRALNLADALLHVPATDPTNQLEKLRAGALEQLARWTAELEATGRWDA